MMSRQSVAVLGTAIISFGALLGAQSPGQAPTTPPPAVHDRAGTSDSAKTDHGFVTETAMDGMAEVELGRLASNQATNDKVKAFGQRMVTDHEKANNELKSLAASKQITLPASLDAKHQAMHDRFAKLSGAEFDRAYVRDMVADHKKAVAMFSKESMSGKDSEIKAWAAKTLPTLREHLSMIEGIQKDMGTARATK